MFHFSAFAQISASGLNPNAVPANEFFVGKELGKPLVTVSILSGVGRPGVYHVPKGTDLASLIAYAGGSLEKADLSDVSLRRELNGTNSQESINFHKIAGTTRPFPELINQDVVFIPPRKTLDNTLTWVTLVSSLASIALSVALINDINTR